MRTTLGNLGAAAPSGPARAGALRSKYVNDSVETMSPGRQIVALYDRLLLDLDRAVEAIGNAQLPAAHDCVMHAQDIVTHLYDSLDEQQWPAARNLKDIYAFVRTELVAANVDKDARKIAECRKLLTPLRDAWRDAAGIVATNT
jgi:flagellar protein FliS